MRHRWLGVRSRRSLQTVVDFCSTNHRVSPLPDGVLAYPLEVSLGRRPIVVTPEGHPDRNELVESFRRSPSVRVTDGRDVAAMATVTLDDDGVTLLDAQGQSYWSAPRPVTEGTKALMSNALTKLARATHVRELASGTGQAQLPEADHETVSLTFTRVIPATGEEIEIQPGEHLHVEDAVIIRAHNTTAETRYVSVIDVGLTGAIVIVTASQPSWNDHRTRGHLRCRGECGARDRRDPAVLARWTTKNWAPPRDPHHPDRRQANRGPNLTRATWPANSTEGRSNTSQERHRPTPR